MCCIIVYYIRSYHIISDHIMLCVFVVIVCVVQYSNMLHYIIS